MAAKRPVLGSRPSDTISRTVSSAVGSVCCASHDRREARTPAGIVARLWPSILTSPERKVCKPAKARSKVDLPAPFGPTIADQPAPKVSVTSRNASVVPSVTLAFSTCNVVIAVGRDAAAR